MTSVTLLAWLTLLPVLVKLRRVLAGTSLQLAWGWATVLWLGAAIVVLLTAWTNVSAGPAHLLWYSVAVLLLVPPIAVLGARRPIHRVWSPFVLLPLLLVFLWPALSGLGRGRVPAVWTIEEPILVGYGLVLLMGTGNYFGLRMTGPALLYALAGIVLVIPLCPPTAGWWSFSVPAGHVSLWLLTIAGWLGVFLGGRRAVVARDTFDPLNSVWCDFRDTFGIVWARRVLERVNESCRQSGGKVRLGMQGFEMDATDTADRTGAGNQLSIAESSLRRTMQKFVDADWIDRRLQANRSEQGI